MRYAQPPQFDLRTPFTSYVLRFTFHVLRFRTFSFNSPRMQNVLDFLRENESRFIGQLCDYVRFPSVSAQSHHKKDVQSAAKWLVAHRQSICLHAKSCKTSVKPVLVAQTPR